MMGPRRIVLFRSVLAFLFASATTASAQDICAPSDTIAPLRLLRQASLDLRGRVPSFSDLEAVRDAASPAKAAEDMVEAWFSQEEYLRGIRDRHNKLLWSSLDSSGTLQPGFARMGATRINRADGSGSDIIYYTVGMRRIYRGSRAALCANTPASFDEDGEVLFDLVDDPGCPAEGCKQEGYVWVAPHWDPEYPVRVCAFDAQPWERPACVRSFNDPACGCGDNLERCLSFRHEGPLKDAMAEEPGRIVEWVVRNNRSYIESLTTKVGFVNGASAYYYDKLVHPGYDDRGDMFTFDAAYGDMPEMKYTDLAWRQVERESMHAGVLTTTAFMLRFASDRARASRFYDAFLCQPFVASGNALPAGGADPHPNLRERAGCADCHRTLEPAADHWARWRDQGRIGFLRPEVVDLETPWRRLRLGEMVDYCRDCGAEGGFGCGFFCDTFFVTRNNAHPLEFEAFGGQLQAVAWSDAADFSRMEAGPGALVNEPHEQEQVARCATRRMAESLLHRALSPEELPWLERHTRAFVDSGFDYTSMVRGLVRDEKYRRVR